MAALTCAVCNAELDLSAPFCDGCGTSIQAAIRTARPQRPVGVADDDPPEAGGDEPAGEVDAPSTVGEATGQTGTGEVPGARCREDSCGMPLPDGAQRCPYCGRSVEADDAQAAPTAPPDGTVLPGGLGDRFTVVHELPATGAEADLFIVDDRDTGHRSILKLYRTGIEVDAGVLEVLGRADIAHVVRIEDHGVAAGRAFEVLEYVPAGDLERFRQRHGPAVDAEVVRMVLQELADALEHLHGLGLKHGDVKPANILVRTEEPLDLVLTDFGLAALPEATLVFRDDARRSRLYAAPEQLARGEGMPPDVWALGVIVTELLLGAHPFERLAPGTVDYHLLSQPWPVEPDLVEDEAWRPFLRGTLHRDPERRWTIGQVQDWLAGLDPPEVADPAGHGGTTQAFDFEGRRFTSPAALAAALVARWGPGSSRIAHGGVQNWIRARGDDPRLESWFEELDELELDEHAKLLRASLRMDPELTPTYRGYDVSPAGLPGLAAAAVRGGTDSEEATVLRSFLDQDGPAAIAELTGSPEHGAIAEQVSRLSHQLRELLDVAAEAGMDTDGVEPVARLRLFQLRVDPDELAALRRQVTRRLPSDLPDWYAGLLEDEPSPAQVVVAAAFRESVEEQLEATRAEREAARLQARATGSDAAARLSRLVRPAIGTSAAALALFAPVATLAGLLAYAAGSRYGLALRDWFRTEQAVGWSASRVLSLPLLAVRWLIVAVGVLLRDLVVALMAVGLFLTVVLVVAGAGHAMAELAVPQELFLRRLSVPAVAFLAATWLAGDRGADEPYRLLARGVRRLRLAPVVALLPVVLLPVALLYAGWTAGEPDPTARIEPMALESLDRVEGWLDDTFLGDATVDRPETVVDEEPDDGATGAPGAPPGERWVVSGVTELNVRAGPGLEHEVVTTLGEGEGRPATGRTEQVEDIEWIELELSDGGRGWASGRYLDRDG